jgi:glycosyltransferase involved in cell wall biosynthesis
MINNDKKSISGGFSVAMCVYYKDDPRHFKEAVESVIDQTVKPDEIILTVDGPVPDELEAEIRKFEKLSFFKTLRLEKNSGHGIARRAGLEKCTRPLVALMDADDICVPDRFEKQLASFEEDGDLSIVGSDISEFIGTVENVIGIRDLPAEDSAVKKYMKYRCPFNQMTVMFKLKDVTDAGGYLDWYCDEDYYLWIRMFQKGFKFRNIKESLVMVRVTEGTYERRGGRKYYESEKGIQKYMLENNIISLPVYIYNITIRYVLQVMMPNRLRAFVFHNFARKKIIKKTLGMFNAKKI